MRYDTGYRKSRMITFEGPVSFTNFASNRSAHQCGCCGIDFRVHCLGCELRHGVRSRKDRTICTVCIKRRDIDRWLERGHDYEPEDMTP